jgi:hypothetical protein
MEVGRGSGLPVKLTRAVTSKRVSGFRLGGFESFKNQGVRMALLLTT